MLQREPPESSLVISGNSLFLHFAARVARAVSAESIVKYIVDGEAVLPRAPSGPIAPHLRAFAASQRGQGYAPYSLYRRVVVAAGFSRWLGQRGVALRSVAFDHQAQYLRYRARHLKPRSDDACSLRRLVEFLRREGLVRSEKSTVSSLTPVERCARAYEQYLYEACASAKATVVSYGAFVRDFLDHCFASAQCGSDNFAVRFVQQRATRMS